MEQWAGPEQPAAPPLPPLAFGDVRPPVVQRSSAGPARLGRYRITGVIGRGGMGSVYRGHDDALGRDVAVKVIHDRFGSADNVIRRFGEEATAASDLYSLGVTLYELLAGTTPFPADSPLKLLRRIAAEEPLPIRAHRDDMPPAFEAWLEKLLARDPARRFSSAAAALDALRQVEILAAGSDDFGTVRFEVEATGTGPTIIINGRRVSP